jgi:hypothetical protein
LFIYVDGEVGAAGNIMNSPWDRLLKPNPLLSILDYTLKDDEWSILTTHGVSYWERFKVAGYETIIYRLATKLTTKIPNWIFSKEILMPNENELNIEISSSLALHGVLNKEYIQLNSLSNIEKLVKISKIMICNSVLSIMRKRVEQWVIPSAVEITMELFRDFLENQLKQFKYLINEWGKVIVKSNKVKQSVLVNAPGNVRGNALSYVCRKGDIPLISSQNGVSVEISKAHIMLQSAFENNVSDIIFSYNSKIVDIEKNTHFDKSKHYSVGMPLRHMRMKRSKITDKFMLPIVYISTNLYHMGFSLSLKTDYGSAIDEQSIIDRVLSKLPHKVCYKTYPEDNRRYADVDPVLNNANMANNIEVFDKKIDMRYLISKYRVMVTTRATSTLGWPVMSDRPVVFINQKNSIPLRDDDDQNFYNNLRDFLSQPIEEIERLWQIKSEARKEMVKDFFSEYKGGAGKRAAKIILKECLN